MDLLKVINERRSIRKYKNEPVSDETIHEVLEAARKAPSWANTQVCRYIVVKDPKIKEQLSNVLTPTNPARGAMVEAPCVICIFAKRGVSGFYKGTAATDKEDWFMFDAGVAMEHIVLTAWDLGLGTVHVGLFDAKKAEDILHIPEGFSIVEMTPLGYFEDTPGSRPRKELSELASLDKYGKPYL